MDVEYFKEQQTVEQQKEELTTFRPEASSGKRNERQYEKAHEFMEKKRVTAKREKYKSDKGRGER